MKPVHPVYVKLKPGDRYRDTVSFLNKKTGNRLTLDAVVPEDETLSNMYLPCGIVESIPDYESPTGKPLGIEPGDLVWGNAMMFSMEWHDKSVIRTHPLRDYVHVNLLVALERNGKVYGVPEMEATTNKSGFLEFRYGIDQTLIGRHRRDLHFKIQGNRRTMDRVVYTLQEDCDFELDLLGYSTFEIISEGLHKGRILYVDMPTPFVVDRAQCEKKGFSTVLEDGTYYGFRLRDAVGEVIVSQD